MNSIGWVDGTGRNYLIAVLSTGNPSEQYGIDSIVASVLRQCGKRCQPTASYPRSITVLQGGQSWEVPLRRVPGGLGELSVLAEAALTLGAATEVRPTQPPRRPRVRESPHEPPLRACRLAWLEGTSGQRHGALPRTRSS